ncbi:PqqD family peptide modification chaperone [Granulicella sp. dw_53]|uniref:PqqD family peptide modification chaperone n=1 Tax=Granulicella sp. dw_53 TaxID=2719792 RepID=UPI0021022077|nr:PqqD family peptide modification chaperone [Granulicella sp. dw_53]
MNSIPRLAPGCRLHPTESVLLVPEGTLNLTGPTREILTRLDGTQTVTSIVTELLKQYEGADAVEVQADVLGLLDRMQQRGVIRI